MKSTVLTLTLIGTAIAAPTRTIERRTFGNLPSFDTTSGLGSLSSLFPVPSGLGGLGGSSGGGLSDLFGSSSSGSSSSGGWLSNLFGSAGSSSGGLSDLFGSGTGSSTSSGSSSSSLPGTTDTPSIPSIGDIPSLGGSSDDSSSDSGSSSGLGGLLSGLGGSSTSNGVTDNEPCQPLTFIFARGTTELGNMGNTVGPAVAEQLKSLTGDKVVIQGVDYPASAAGNAALGAQGGPEMANLVGQALKQCPKTKVVLGGYSQGAMVVHNAAKKLSSGQVAGAVLFGDPFKDQPLDNVDASAVKEYCAQGDPVCLNGGNVMAHLSYTTNAEEAAKFLVDAAGVSGA